MAENMVDIHVAYPQTQKGRKETLVAANFSLCSHENTLLATIISLHSRKSVYFL